MEHIETSGEPARESAAEQIRRMESGDDFLINLEFLAGKFGTRTFSFEEVENACNDQKLQRRGDSPLSKEEIRTLLEGLIEDGKIALDRDAGRYHVVGRA